jgi:hypothetical protein
MFLAEIKINLAKKLEKLNLDIERYVFLIKLLPKLASKM